MSWLLSCWETKPAAHNTSSTSPQSVDENASISKRCVVKLHRGQGYSRVLASIGVYQDIYNHNIGFGVLAKENCGSNRTGQMQCVTHSWDIFSLSKKVWALQKHTEGGLTEPVCHIQNSPMSFLLHRWKQLVRRHASSWRWRRTCDASSPYCVEQNFPKPVGKTAKKKNVLSSPLVVLYPQITACGLVRLKTFQEGSFQDESARFLTWNLSNAAALKAQRGVVLKPFERVLTCQKWGANHIIISRRINSIWSSLFEETVSAVIKNEV